MRRAWLLLIIAVTALVTTGVLYFRAAAQFQREQQEEEAEAIARRGLEARILAREAAQAASGSDGAGAAAPAQRQGSGSGEAMSEEGVSPADQTEAEPAGQEGTAAGEPASSEAAAQAEATQDDGTLGAMAPERESALERMHDAQLLGGTSGGLPQLAGGTTPLPQLIGGTTDAVPPLWSGTTGAIPQDPAVTEPAVAEASTDGPTVHVTGWVHAGDGTQVSDFDVVPLGGADEGPIHVTGAQGELSIRVPADAQQLDIRAPGYLLYRVDVPAEDDSLDIRLEPSRTLSGTVVDPSGAPVAGAQVQCDACDPAGTTTDASGAFSLDTLTRNEQVHLVARANGLVAEAVAGARLRLKLGPARGR